MPCSDCSAWHGVNPNLKKKRRLHGKINVMSNLVADQMAVLLRIDTTILFSKHTDTVSFARYWNNSHIFSNTSKEFDKFVGNLSKARTFLLLPIPVLLWQSFWYYFQQNSPKQHQVLPLSFYTQFVTLTWFGNLLQLPIGFNWFTSLTPFNRVISTIGMMLETVMLF